MSMDLRSADTQRRPAFAKLTSSSFLMTPVENENLVSEKPVVRQPASMMPLREEIEVLGTVERAGFSLVRRMNFGVWKRFWTFCQRHIGSLWIFIATYNLMNVFGVENVENSDASRPLILVANHRSFFDMYTVS